MDDKIEIVDALPKLFVRNLKTNKEEELVISKEEVISPGISLMQKDRNTDVLRIDMNLQGHLQSL